MSDYVPLYNFDSLEHDLRASLDRMNLEVDAFFKRFPYRPDRRAPEQQKILDELMHEMWRIMSKISESIPTWATEMQVLTAEATGEHRQLAEKSKSLGLDEPHQSQYEAYCQAEAAEAYRRHPWLSEFEQAMNNQIDKGNIE